ncbi:cysteine desulfurase family protein [Alkalibacterium sp. 20]|uniref:cysteine desulfurase family protein n=1 Tax=Alkalibacterium sp. 20 TaxID=1798803 RepID=UPI0009004819|nr:cysteine desulfurase family protein [Alkalibacterium sp. 20]OJF95723.1 cysteine desulfurase NifS [Alkalibacterium sp. 20]
MTETIYLDHAATTPMHPKVIDEMTDAMKNHYGNASSIHQIGRESKGILEEARLTFAKSIHAKPHEIIITSGGTESDNMAIIKTAEKLKEYGKHIITTAVEHPAVLEPMEHLESEGFDVTFLPVNEDGEVTLEQVKEAIREDTILISIMYGNNEIGSLMPIRAIGDYLKELDTKILFHTDAVQAYGTEDIDVKRDNIDLLSVSAHKINGPKGIGFLYINQAVVIPSLIMGGEQENNKRAGTENIPAIVGFKKAVELRMENKEKSRDSYSQLKRLFIKEFKETEIDFIVNGSVEKSLPHILSIHIKSVPAEKLLIHLDLAKIAVSIGSACTAGNIEPSHVLIALYDEKHPAVEETIRISFGQDVTEEMIRKTVDKLEYACTFLKKN